ncbi:MAG: acetylornithine transaminase [Buchananella hordeovulneris]|nr:acetylornithine transaminase [Buchananella hordeovulneris]
MSDLLADVAAPTARNTASAASADASVEEKHAQAVLNTFGAVQKAFVSGQGNYLLDADGKRYLDLLGGIAVSCLGHGHPALVEAISAAAKSMLHTSNFFATPAQVELAQRLIELSVPAELRPHSRVFLANSGTEANEAALKVALRFGGSQKQRLIALEGAFHGRTTGALSLTHKEAYRLPFAPFMREVTFVAPGEQDALARELARGDVAAVFVEPIQGERGVRAVDADYLRAARRLCTEHGALLVVDEVQTGAFRTGDFLAHHRAGIVPDVVTMAKSLGGGVPIGATLVIGEANCALLGPGSHGTTYGGNPLAAAAALAVLRTVSGQLRERIGELSAAWSQELARVEGVSEVRAYGLLVALELDQSEGEVPSSLVARELLKQGFIVNAVTPTALRLAPPYTLTDQEAASFTEALAATLAALRAQASTPAQISTNHASAAPAASDPAGETSSTKEER